MLISLVYLFNFKFRGLILNVYTKGQRPSGKKRWPNYPSQLCLVSVYQEQLHGHAGDVIPHTTTSLHRTYATTRLVYLLNLYIKEMSSPISAFDT